MTSQTPGAQGARTDLAYLSASDALAAFRARTLSPVELLDALYAQADALEPKVNAIVHRRREAAYAAAREAEQRYGGRGGGAPRALEGLPVALKEEQPITGEPSEGGCLLLRGTIAADTHPLVTRIVEAGGVPHIRTTTPEFSSAGFTHSRLWGVTRNPWNPDYTPGGSSGGSGAALAAGMAPLATGSDIGGSIRLPASLSGVVGYKPPYGRVPAMAPWNLDTYCHDGPMARTVADTALLENVIAGQHPDDIVSLPAPGPVEAGARAVERMRGRRVVFARTMGDTPVEPEIAAAIERSARGLEALGVHVEEVTLDVPMHLLGEAAFTHYGTMFGPSVDEVVNGPEDEAQLTGYARALRDRAAAALARNGVYAGALAESEIARRTLEAMGGAELLLLPTLATLGWLAGDDYTETPCVVNGVALDFYLTAGLTPIFNVLARRPVLSVPMGLASNGVPMGVQVVGRPYADQDVFDGGAALEALAGPGGWWAREDWRPPMAR